MKENNAQKIIEDSLEWNICIPDNYEEMNLDLYPNLKNENFRNPKLYGMANSNTEAVIYNFMVEKGSVTEFNTIEEAIKAYHDKMTDNYGLIEVENRKNNSGNEYNYVIYKTHMNDDQLPGVGNIYQVYFYLPKGENVHVLICTFKEVGVTGMRDNIIFANYQKNHKGDNQFDEWSFDPYDPDYKKGFLMNQSEKREYDEMFPEHPLSEARKFIDFVVNNN